MQDKYKLDKTYTKEEDIACEAILKERLDLIKRVDNERGIENFCMSWSGGRDSCVMSELFDMAVQNNKIPRIYADTGLELNIMRDFIRYKMSKDDRIVRIPPTVKIKPMLEEYGYPYSSKKHSAMVELFRRKGLTTSVKNYIGLGEEKYSTSNSCPKRLMFQFDINNEYKKFNTFPISDKCCYYLKEKPLNDWKKNHGYEYNVIGIMADEGGRRKSAECFVYHRDKLTTFNPLAPLTKEWESWFIQKYNIDICDIYKPPYNVERTGCKGCPFSLSLNESLDMLQEYFPNERKQCENLWKPVYDQYRLLRYRLLKKIK